MENFFTPTNIQDFVKWLIDTSIDNRWTIVLEYSPENENALLSKIKTTNDLPQSARRNYSSDSKLISLANSSASAILVDTIIELAHCLSIHDKDGMLFLIADDFYEECFSCSKDFYIKYSDIILTKKLAINGQTNNYR